MSRVCEICGKGPAAGRSIKRRGMARRKGGAGRKITGITPRRCLPNLKIVKAIINGARKRIKVCTKCLKAGKVKKAV
ncbi:MAG: 50S ribosomal protein L28 [Candidatus Omnitrophica bacterium CG07_land_8_20_14_0_80_42_15]|uniref:Large ribosomal subunit protein bL28 n=1 Tax=Candidatus Aquitaenariimonas noxiae TaxID=1974741 RepID=A0A2J0KZW5_9BACT|nr:MAG: 50S ribosomal protein L28 [Candidatus Omnitrophica bacterium CG07_land_8_20_14_0_80_42_15]